MSSTIVETALSDQDLLTVVTEVWRTYLRDDAQEPLPAGRRMGTAVAISAVVGFTGSWQGHLRIDCGSRAATDIAALMLDKPADNLPENAVTTALGKLATAVSGRVIAFLPAPTSLCLPVVSPTGAYHLRLPGCHETNHAMVTWHDETIQFQVLQAAPPTRAGSRA